MSKERTMLGGRHYKIIREVLGAEWVNGVMAFEDGEDLCVHPKVFDAFEDVAKRKHGDEWMEHPAVTLD